MNNVFVYVGFTFLLTLLLIFGGLLGFKLKANAEKGSPFECGFDPTGVCRVPFCIKFFMIRIIFLVFDVEVALIFPIVYGGYQVITFLLVLLAGLVYEWVYGGLQWIV